jgi:hypothetical protein
MYATSYHFRVASVTEILMCLAEDILVMKDDQNTEWRWSVYVDEEGKYLALYIAKDVSRVRRAPVLLFF